MHIVDIEEGRDHVKPPSWKIVSALAAIAAAAAGTVVVAPSALAGSNTAASGGCPTTAVFETDGYKHGETLDNWNNTNFNKHVPAGYQIVQVPYDAQVFPVADDQALDAAVAEGVGKLDKAVRDFHASCPSAQVRLAGYSEGALVAGNVLEDFAKSSDIPHDQLSGVLYGDPRRPFGDGGTGGTAGGIETNLPSILPSVTMQGPHDFGDIPVREVCNENDGICNSANMITNLLAFANGLVGYSSGDHGYDMDPARDAGDGLILHQQAPRVNYGAPLPVSVGTPWQIQQQLGGGKSLDKAVAARSALAGALSPAQLKALDDDPWYQLLKSA